MEECDLIVEGNTANRGASLIALWRVQSYVALGFPSWFYFGVLGAIFVYPLESFCCTRLIFSDYWLCFEGLWA